MGDPRVVNSLHAGTVFGDVFQIGGNGIPIPSRFHLAPWPRRVDVAPGLVRERPGLLLEERFAVVPLTGRDDVLAGLGAWADGPDEVSVRLVHAAGGAGKTRLAAEFARRLTDRGWLVLAADLDPGRAPAPRSGEVAGVLYVVDYADRWPSARLVELARERRGPRVRVLALARSADFWWSALSRRLSSVDGIPATETALGEVAVDRSELFRLACARFGAVLDRPADIPLPVDLSSSRFDSVLSVLMAALVGVDTGGELPRDFAAHLIERERAYWHGLHTRVAEPMATPPWLMNRLVTLATLTGPLAYADARAALRATDLTESHSADALLADHAKCYPNGDGVVLTPLRPDRLGEDLVALSTDPWLPGAVRALLDRAPWNAHVLTVLVETATRSSAVLTELVEPALRADPGLAARGGRAVARLVDAVDLDVGLLTALEAHLPFGGGADLDIAAAAVARKLASHYPSGGTRARVLNLLAYRLAHAERWDEAVVAADESVRLYRELSSAELAFALTNQGWILAGAGLLDRATAASLEAVERHRELDDPAALAAALANAASVAWRVGDVATMAVTAAESVTRYRAVPTTDPSALAAALVNLAVAHSVSGDPVTALGLAREAEQLHATTGGAAAARTANQVAELCWETGDHAAGLAAADRALAALASADSPGERVLVLINRALCLAGLDRIPAALADIATAMTILQLTPSTSATAVPPARRGLAAHVLNTHGGLLLDLGERLPEALLAIERSLELIDLIPAPTRHDLAVRADGEDVRARLRAALA
ncbi:hypothetical protein [Actinokineospora enzanensis]|uniref:hypothetical protein n=1 Tax=Actinokineospora enzanensis TaxID=155975 RepID=UPI00037938E3|nr:hypothetical protein [Actinokineospora enzanensis]